MSEPGGRVVAVLASDRPLRQAFAAAFAQQGDKVVGVPLDTPPANFVKAHPDIDTLILMLPFAPVSATLELSDTTWESAGTAVLSGCFQWIQAVGVGMVSRQNGLILVVGGLSGLSGFPCWAASSALEGAFVALTRSLACEWAPHRVRVVYLACGAVEGEYMPMQRPDEYTLTHNAMERTPLKRAATPHEIAQIALYLASSRAGFVTGSTIRADGGWTSWGLLK